MLQLIVIPVLAISLLLFLHARLSPPEKTLPPSPTKLPIIGNLHQLCKFPHRSLHSLSNHYGPLMLLHLGHVPVLVASSADAARELMKNQDLIFSSRPKMTSPDKLIYGSRDVAFSPHGEYWRQIRSICVVQLLSSRRVQSYRCVREEETSFMVEKMMGLADSDSVLNLSDVLVSLTNNVICRVALGRKYGEDRDGKKFRSLLGEFVELLGTSVVGDYVPWLAWTNGFNGFNARMARVARMFDEFLEDVVREHREKREKDGAMDFVDVLLEFQRENGGSSPVEDDAIKALILDIFAAGTDTTSAALEWTMAELIKNPTVMKTLQDEAREAAGSNGEIDEDDLEKMPYLKAVLKESLRLHPPIPLLLPHESTQDTKVMGYDIVCGTRVMINAWGIGRDPSLWEKPEEFRPERFLDTSINFNGLHFELIPFGAGRRGCPGVAFATSVLELGLAKLVHKFDFGLPNGGTGEDLDMAEASGITIHRKSPLSVLIIPRV